MKSATIFYYAAEAAQAKSLANAERKEQRDGFARDATTFDGAVEKCSRVVILPSVASHHRKMIEEAYGNIVERPEPEKAKETLVVEDGTGIADANSYSRVADVLAPRGRGRPSKVSA